MLAALETLLSWSEAAFKHPVLGRHATRASPAPHGHLVPAGPCNVVSHLDDQDGPASKAVPVPAGCAVVAPEGWRCRLCRLSEGQGIRPLPSEGSWPVPLCALWAMRRHSVPGRAVRPAAHGWMDENTGMSTTKHAKMCAKADHGRSSSAWLRPPLTGLRGHARLSLITGGSGRCRPRIPGFSSAWSEAVYPSGPDPPRSAMS